MSDEDNKKLAEELMKSVDVIAQHRDGAQGGDHIKSAWNLAAVIKGIAQTQTNTTAIFFAMQKMLFEGDEKGFKEVLRENILNISERKKLGK